MDDQAPYSLPPEGEHEPHAIYRRLIEYPEFQEVAEGEPVVRFLLATDPVVKQGRQILGTCYLPTVQGQLKRLFDWMLNAYFQIRPDFLIILDQEFWEKADPAMREILVFHEMKHMGHARDRDGELRFTEEGGPVWALQGHDVEEFVDTVARYGAYSADIAAFVSAVRGL